jgi:hypothetical protein
MEDNVQVKLWPEYRSKKSQYLSSCALVFTSIIFPTSREHSSCGAIEDDSGSIYGDGRCDGG